MKKWIQSSGIHSAAIACGYAVVAGVIAATGCTARAGAQQPLWSQRAADAAMARWPAGRFTPSDKPWRWSDEPGALPEGMHAMWYDAADRKYYAYLKQSVDHFVQPDGSISTYDPAAHSLDDILPGRQLLLLYRVTQDKRYYKAATLLRQQLSAQPENASGSFSHQPLDPGTTPLTDLYKAGPFYAEYASVFAEPQDFPEITRQFVLAEQPAHGGKASLLHPGGNPSKQPVANPLTGDAASFAARDMGWYLMALVDTLPYYPMNDPGRAQLLAILHRAARAVARDQDQDTGLWYQTLDQPRANGDHVDASATCMFTYALAKGVRRGYLPPTYAANADRGWKGIKTRFLQPSPDPRLGSSQPSNATDSADLLSPAIDNDPKRMGAFLLAANEMELNHRSTLGRGATVVMDGWYNNEQRKAAAGNAVEFHYKWEDYSNPGFSLFGHIFRSYGVATDTLYAAPTLQNLKDARFYVIASPDNLAKTPDPHYMNQRDAKQVAAWVKQGGTLLLMENDPANADIPHLDLLADIFGLHFNNALTHHVIGDDFSAGLIDLPQAAPPFTHPHKLYMKDTCSLKLSGHAVAQLTYKGDILMASARYGKGFVFAVADPWLYNEYTDGRKLPAEFDNFAAGQEWVYWLLQRHPR